jgi:copper(I)-binding protein
MKGSDMRHASVIMAAMLILFGAGAQPQAQAPGRTVLVERPWARATPPGAQTGAAYMTLVNNGAVVERLLGATSPLADKVQFHATVEEKGVSRMRETPTIEISPGAKATFAPGGQHIMLVGLKQPLKEGQSLPLTLEFETAGRIEAVVPIAKIGAMSPGP